VDIYMKLLLFTTRNCLGCIAHLKAVTELAKEYGIGLVVHDIDDPKNFMRSLAAMRKYSLATMPSVVFINVHGIVISSVAGNGENSMKILRKSVAENCEKK
jgi:thiol-disulfide isomerase/thioredoxin